MAPLLSTSPLLLQALDAVGNAGTKALDAAKAVIGGAGDMAGGAADKLSDVSGDAAQAAGAAGRRTKDVAGDLGQRTAGMVSAAGSAAAAAGSTVGEAGRKAVAAVRGKLPGKGAEGSSTAGPVAEGRERDGESGWRRNGQGDLVSEVGDYNGWTGLGGGHGRPIAEGQEDGKSGGQDKGKDKEGEAKEKKSSGGGGFMKTLKGSIGMGGSSSKAGKETKEASEAASAAAAAAETKQKQKGAAVAPGPPLKKSNSGLPSTGGAPKPAPAVQPSAVASTGVSPVSQQGANLVVAPPAALTAPVG